MAGSDPRYKPTWRAEHQLDRSVFAYQDLQWVTVPLLLVVLFFLVAIVGVSVGVQQLGQLAALTSVSLLLAVILGASLRPDIEIEIDATRLTVRGVGLRTLSAPLDQVSAEVVDHGPHPYEPEKHPASMVLHVGMQTVTVPTVALLEDLQAFQEALEGHRRTAVERLGESSDVPEQLARARSGAHQEP